MNKNSARDFFLYLLGSISLYYVAVWLITLWFQYVNYFFPTGNYGGRVNESMKFAVASLIIVFPIYIALVWYLGKLVDREPERKALGIGRWLSYLTLAAAAVTIVISLVTLVFNLLEGEFTLRFLLKTFSVLLVAAMVFVYYFFDIKHKPEHKNLRRIFFWIAIILVAVSVVGSFFVFGSPNKNRMIENDATRVNHLSRIQWDIISYYKNKGVLPQNLSNLEDSISGFRVPVDPKTKEAFEYQIAGELKFLLCATFELSSEDADTPAYKEGISYPYDYYQPDDNWDHESGRVCFERSIDPDRYPVREGLLVD